MGTGCSGHLGLASRLNTEHARPVLVRQHARPGHVGKIISSDTSVSTGEPRCHRNLDPAIRGVGIALYGEVVDAIDRLFAPGGRQFCAS